MVGRLWPLVAAVLVWATPAAAQDTPTEPEWPQLLAQRHFAQLESQMEAAMSAAAVDRAAYQRWGGLLNRLAHAKPATSAPFDAWVAERQSGLAYLARGKFYLAQAWKARGHKYASKTHADAFVRMGQLLEPARSDFETAIRKFQGKCDSCHAGLFEALVLARDRRQAVEALDQALLALGGGLDTPRTYMTYLQPRWGGSFAEMSRFVDRFTRDYPGHAAIPMLRSALLQYQSDTHFERRDWQQVLLLSRQAVAVDPLNWRAWASIASAGLYLDQDGVVLEATERALALHPEHVSALTARASVLMKGPAPLEAVPFLERAVALGDDWALKALLPIVAAGKYGFKPDRARAEAICQSAIDALMPPGFACMGGLDYFGIGRPANRPRALQWFLQASERGVPEAMVDAGIMLVRGDGVPMDRERGIELLVQGHMSGEPRAQSHLRQHLSTLEYARHVQWPELQQWARQALAQDATQARLPIYLAVLLAGSLFWSLAYRAGNAPAIRQGSRRLLRPGFLIRMVTVLNLALMGVAWWAVGFVPAGYRLGAWAVFLLLLAGALYLFYAVFLVRIWFDGTGLHARSPFWRRSIRFDEVVDVGWSWLAHSDYVQDRHGRRVYVSHLLRGNAELMDHLEPHLDRYRETEPLRL